jgi:hypothetical protein
MVKEQAKDALYSVVMSELSGTLHGAHTTEDQSVAQIRFIAQANEVYAEKYHVSEFRAIKIINDTVHDITSADPSGNFITYCVDRASTK